MASSHAVATIVSGVSTLDDAVNVIASNAGVSAAGTCARIHSSTAVSTGPDWPFSVSSATITAAAHQREQAHHRRAAAVDVLAPWRALQPQHQPQREPHRDHAERQLSNVLPRLRAASADRFALRGAQHRAERVPIGQRARLS